MLAKDQMAAYAANGMMASVKGLAGTIRAFEGLHDDLTKPRVNPEEGTQDSTFVDPARRRVNGR